MNFSNLNLNKTINSKMMKTSETCYFVFFFFFQYIDALGIFCKKQTKVNTKLLIQNI